MMQSPGSGGKKCRKFMSMPSRAAPRSRSALIKDITDAVVKNFEVTADAVLVEIIESSRDNKAKGGVLFSER